MKKLIYLFSCVLFIGFGASAQVSEATSNSINLSSLIKKKEVAKPMTPVMSTSVAAANSVEIVLNSDVDINIPKTSTVNNDGIAVIIGNRNYRYTKNVDFAINDARAMKLYLTQTMGYKEGNIFYFEDATKTDFEVLFGNRDTHEGKVFNAIKPGRSDLFVFYAGHGAPDLKTNTGYFVPVETDPSFINVSGYSSEIFFENISMIPARSVTVVMDACFSGAEILQGISPIGIKSKTFDSVQNGILLSSSSGTQVSSWYMEQSHGMFTYFFLKAIQDGNADFNKDGSITAEEIYQYVADNSDGVPYYARRYHNVVQTPTLQGDMRDKVIVQFD